MASTERPTRPTSSSSADSSTPPPLSVWAWARWCWRHLTSMRTALVLLFLLAIGAIPGSALPQRTVSVEQVQDFYRENPEVAPVLDRLYLFDVYSSPWFAAVYLLLFVSLTGCVIPRAAAHYRAMRARPPRAPRNFARLPYSARFTTTATPETVLAEAKSVLARYRTDTDTSPDSVAAEKGHLREVGNLVFHVALLALLLALAAGALFGYRGNMLLVEGDGFANTVASYDAFYPGSAVGAEDLQPFTIWLEEFEATFVTDGEFAGQAESFTARLRYQASPEGQEGVHELAVNQPLSVDGAQVYLLGHGYAPEFQVTNAEGEVVFDQPVPFLDREEGTLTSDGVLKVPDALPEPLGFTGVFLPSPRENAQGDLVSAFPGARDPVVVLEGYQGDLGLDSGEPQSVYQLHTSRMEALGESPVLGVGESWELPDGAGTLTFTGYREYVSMQVNSDPGRVPVLLAAVAAVVGLLGTLFVRPRRCWIRATADDDGRTTVEVGGLGKTEGAASTVEFHEITTRLRGRLQEGPSAGQSDKE